MFNRFLDKLSEYFAARKGLLPLVGVVMILVNWGLQLFFPGIWLTETNFFLHLGLIVAIIGILLAWAL